MSNSKFESMMARIRVCLVENEGQLLTLDLLLSLIPLVLVLGISANAMTGVVNQMQDYVYGYDRQRVVDDAVDVLVKTAGEPPTWTANNTPSILGLARFNSTGGSILNTYYLDSNKVLALDTIFGTTMPALLSNSTTSFSYIQLSFEGASNSTTNSTLNWTIGTRSSANDVFVARRIALLRFEDLLGQFLDIHKFFQTQKCGDTGVNPLFMVEFNVTASELATFDYWLVVETNDSSGNKPASDWGIDREDGSGNFNVIANETDCDNYSPLNSNTDDRGAIFPCNVNNPPYAPGSGQDEICDEGVTESGVAFYKVKLDSYLTSAGNGGNRLIIEVNAASGEDIDAHLIRARTGIDDTVILSELTEFTPFFIDLEAGK